jgi:hypothetical protein
MLNLSLAYKIFSCVRTTAANKSQRATNLKQQNIEILGFSEAKVSKGKA